MKMHTFVMAAALAALPGLAMAADFSGLWVRDAAQSTGTTPAQLYWITRAEVGSGGGGNQGEVAVVVQQTPTTVQVTTGNKPLRLYTVDGRPRTSKADTGIVDQTLTATMRGENLVIATVHPYGGMPGNVMTTTTETWSLSPNGRVLTVETVRAAAAQTVSFKEVYNKRP